MTPEMFRTPLHEVSLLIKLLRLGAIDQFLSKAVESPPIDAVIEAEVMLRGSFVILPFSRISKEITLMLFNTKDCFETMLMKIKRIIIVLLTSVVAPENLILGSI